MAEWVAFIQPDESLPCMVEGCRRWATWMLLRHLHDQPAAAVLEVQFFCSDHHTAMVLGAMFHLEGIEISGDNGR